MYFTVVYGNTLDEISKQLNDYVDNSFTETVELVYLNEIGNINHKYEGLVKIVDAYEEE